MINLLPSFYKIRLRQELRFRLLCVWGVLIFLCIITLSLCLSLSDMYLSKEVLARNVLATEATSSALHEISVGEEIVSWNKDLESIVDTGASSGSASSMLSHVAGAMPEGLFITSLSWTPAITQERKGETLHEPGKISVSGIADSREILFFFREKLQQDSFFETIDFPPANWVTQKNISFSVLLVLHDTYESK